GLLAKAVALHPAKRAADALVNVWVAIPCDQQSAARNQVNQPPEGGLHFIQAVVYVGVVELDRCQNDGVGKVVQKLRAFVEEGGVVLVAFKDELPPRT